MRIGAPIDAQTLTTMSRAALPLDGSIAEQVPGILGAYARLVAPEQWPRLSYVDLTAGSCLLPLMFAAAGIGRVVVNDAAERTHVAARALFGGRPVDPALVDALVTAPEPKLRAHVPSFHFACDYLTAPAADVFDRLFHADLPAADLPACQYLALLWALGFAPSAEDGFRILMTHAEDQLLAMPDEDWSAYVARARDPRGVLRALADSFNAAIALARARDVRITRGDMLDECERIDYGAGGLVAVNPPTRGLDEYVVDDQLPHSLLANRLLPLSMCRESPQEFWTRRVRKALAQVPPGFHYLVYGGDGSMSWAECWAVWAEYGVPAHVARLGPGDAAPGWAIFLRR
jgi:hypothetical protein